MSSPNKLESSIASICSKLPDEALVSLQEFAQFLAQKYPPIAAEEAQKISPISRPKEENVVAAIRRLAKTYPMLDKKILFEQTSTAMTEHVMQDVPSVKSIDRLEAVFEKEYAAYLENTKK